MGNIGTTLKAEQLLKQQNLIQKDVSLRLLNVYSEDNVGDAAIYASIKSMAQSYGYSDIDFNRNSSSKNTVSHSYGLADTQYIAVGGDIFNNARPRLITRQFIKNVMELRKSPQVTSLFGQSIPRSCRGLSFQYLCSALKKLNNVTVRDQESFKRLTQAGVNARLSYDLAFTQSINQEHSNAVSSWFGSQYNFKEVAIISLRSFGNLYQYDNEKFVNDMALLCKLLKTKGVKPVVLLQSKVNESDADSAMIEAISAIEKVDVIDPFEIHKKIPSISAWKIAQIISAKAAIAVGVRYHTSVFRLAAGKMPFNLYYSNKGQDLSDRLDVPGCEVSDFNPHKHLEQILATKDQTFDAKIIADQVKIDFGIALGVDMKTLELIQRGEL